MDRAAGEREREQHDDERKLSFDLSHRSHIELLRRKTSLKSSMFCAVAVYKDNHFLNSFFILFLSLSNNLVKLC